MLDALGQVARVMALPKPQDAIYLALGAAYGAPGLDPEGRLIYRGVIVIPPKPQEPGARAAFRLPEQPDSAPIVRADFDSRKLDTLTTLKVFRPGAMSMTPDAEGNMTLKVTINPMDTGDEWAMLSDGTIAIVRAHDYHIDWVDPDGTHRSTPKMPFDWKRMTDEEKQFKIDSMRPADRQGDRELAGSNDPHGRRSKETHDPVRFRGARQDAGLPTARSRRDRSSPTSMETCGSFRGRPCWRHRPARWCTTW